MLEINNISVKTEKHQNILKGFSLRLEPGQVIGLTGESGAGKSTVVRSIMGILGRGACLCEGDISLEGRNLDRMPDTQRRKLCGTTIGFIPQNPMTAFDSKMKIGRQMEETLRCRLGLSGQQAWALSCEKLTMVNLTDHTHILESLPSQLSGGMLQRVAMALLLGLSPQYVLADEPTSALDESNHKLLLELLMARKEVSGILFVSHDVEALKLLCKDIIILHGGQVIEQGELSAMLQSPGHAWTRRFFQHHGCKQERGFQWKEL